MSIPTDRLQEYAIKFYDALDSAANLEDVEGIKKPVKVFRGRLTEAYKSCGISMAYYSPIRKVLEATNSVQYLRAGNKTTDSCVLLLSRPTPDEIFSVSPLTGAPERATIDRRITALENRLGDLPIQEILINYEERLRALENKASKAKPSTRGRK